MSYNAHPDSATPADIFTPHDDSKHKWTEESETEVVQGIIDPRTLPGPEILQGPPLGLPTPTQEVLDDEGSIFTDEEKKE